jgi:hypothetical protein
VGTPVSFRSERCNQLQQAGNEWGRPFVGPPRESNRRGAHVMRKGRMTSHRLLSHEPGWERNQPRRLT